MLCKCCRDDLPKECYGIAQYRMAMLHGNTQFCSVCSKLAKKQKKSKAAAAIALLNFPLSGRAKKKAAKKAKVSADDARWRGLSMDEKRIDLIGRQTPSERALAAEMTAQGILFEPQVRVCHFYLDFQVMPNQLAIEVDGGYHFTPAQIEADRIRDKTLKKKGWTVMRFRNERIKDELPAVIAEIQAGIVTSTPRAPKPPKWPALPKVGAIALCGFTQKTVVIPPSAQFNYGANEFNDAIARDDRRDALTPAR